MTDDGRKDELSVCIFLHQCESLIKEARMPDILKQDMIDKRVSILYTLCSGVHKYCRLCAVKCRLIWKDI